MKVNFVVSCEVEVDPADWQDCASHDAFFVELEQTCLDNLDGGSPAVCVDARDAAQLWALVRPEEIETGNVQELDQCRQCGAPIWPNSETIEIDGGEIHKGCRAAWEDPDRTFSPTPSA